MSVMEAPETGQRAAQAGSGSRSADRTGPVALTDAEFTQVFTRGFLYGTPAVYLILVGVCLLAAPGHGWLLVAVAWPALFAGWFFGGVVALTVHELRAEPHHRPASVTGARWHRARARLHVRPAGAH